MQYHQVIFYHQLLGRQVTEGCGEKYNLIKRNTFTKWNAKHVTLSNLYRMQANRGPQRNMTYFYCTN